MKVNSCHNLLKTHQQPLAAYKIQTNLCSRRTSPPHLSKLISQAHTPFLCPDPACWAMRLHSAPSAYNTLPPLCFAQQSLLRFSHSLPAGSASLSDRTDHFWSQAPHCPLVTGAFPLYCISLPIWSPPSAACRGHVYLEDLAQCQAHRAWRKNICWMSRRKMDSLRKYWKWF